MIPHLQVSRGNQAIVRPASQKYRGGNPPYTQHAVRRPGNRRRIVRQHTVQIKHNRQVRTTG